MTILEPPSDRILCRMLPAAEETAFGLHLPDQAQAPSMRAEVIAVGAGKVYGDEAVPLGEYLHFSQFTKQRGPSRAALAPGDIVVLPQFVGSEIEYESEEPVISVLAESVLAVET